LSFPGGEVRKRHRLGAVGSAKKGSKTWGKVLDLKSTLISECIGWKRSFPSYIGRGRVEKKRGKRVEGGSGESGPVSSRTPGKSETSSGGVGKKARHKKGDGSRVYALGRPGETMGGGEGRRRRCFQLEERRGQNWPIRSSRGRGNCMMEYEVES